jgi:hypothetical protein
MDAIVASYKSTQTFLQQQVDAVEQQQLMARYATALAGDPAATYRQIDVAGRTADADPHRLVALLYEEGVGACAPPPGRPRRASSRSRANAWRARPR